MGNHGNLLNPLQKRADAVVAVDGRQTILAWNGAAEALLGHAAADVVGRKCYDVMRGRLPSGKKICRAGCVMKRRASGTASLGEMTLLVQHLLGENLLLRINTIALPAFGDGCTVHLVRPAADRHAAPVHEMWLKAAGLSDITRREADVLCALARGMSTREIAERLSVSPLTVRTHIRNLLRKKNLSSQLQLALFAQKSGLA